MAEAATVETFGSLVTSRHTGLVLAIKPHLLVGSLMPGKGYRVREWVNHRLDPLEGAPGDGDGGSPEWAQIEAGAVL